QRILQPRHQHSDERTVRPWPNAQRALSLALWFLCTIQLLLPRHCASLQGTRTFFDLNSKNGEPGLLRPCSPSPTSRHVQLACPAVFFAAFNKVALKL
ncbi:mCG145475, partial [Mus musculus]